MENIAAVILAGGKAQRMNGIIKGNIEIMPGISIIRHLLQEISKAKIKKVIISANETIHYSYYHVPIIADRRHNIGPLAGIEKSMEYFLGKCFSMLILPCDLPNITANEIFLLYTAFKKSKNSIVYATSHCNLNQPLFAIIKIEILNLIVAAIDDGMRKVSDVWHELHATGVKFSDDIFLNVNSFDDLACLPNRGTGNNYLK